MQIVQTALQNLLVRMVPCVPRRVIRRIAGRYIAGETMEDLLRVVASIHAKGFFSTVDVLGENVLSKGAAREAADEYLRLVGRLSGQSSSPQISVKLSLLGLRLEESLASKLAVELASAALRHGVSVFLDMEDSTTTDSTLRIYRRLREGHANVGIAIQAYLYRSVKDALDLVPLRPSVRICKGIYNESPKIAIKDKQAIRESYLKLTAILIEGGAYLAFATHDHFLVDRCITEVKEHGLDAEHHEFQMLLGVGEALRPRILSAGSRIRLYCPYGPDWHAYSLRRLRENPRMAGYVLKNLFTPSMFSRR